MVKLMTRMEEVMARRIARMLDGGGDGQEDN